MPIGGCFKIRGKRGKGVNSIIFNSCHGEQKMLCSKCGEQIKQGSKFCKNCGNPIEIQPKQETTINKNQFTPKTKRFQKEQEGLLSIIEDHPLITAIVIVIICVGLLYFIFSSGGSGSDNPKSPIETVVPTPPPPDPLQVLSETPPSNLEPGGELYEVFRYGTDHTDVQRENKEREITGLIVQWSLPVYEVYRKDYGYKITTSGAAGTIFDPKLYVSTEIHIQPRNSSEVSYIESLKTGDMITFKGKISGVGSFRYIVIDPCILVSGSSGAVNSRQDAVSEKNWVKYDDRFDRYDNVFYYQKGKAGKGGSHIFQVFLKTVYSDAGREKMISIANNLGESTAGLDKLSYEIITAEFDCQNKKSRVLSRKLFFTNNKVLHQESMDKKWDPIFKPEEDDVYTGVCNKKVITK